MFILYNQTFTVTLLNLYVSFELPHTKAINLDCIKSLPSHRQIHVFIHKTEKKILSETTCNGSQENLI